LTATQPEIQSTVKTPVIGEKLLRWIVFNLILALFPLGTTLFVHSLAGKLSYQVVLNSPEILFLALMVSATALRDLYEASPFLRGEMLYTVLYYALFLGLILAAVFYGLFVLDTVNNPSTPVLRAALFKYANFLTIVLCLCSFITILLLSRIESRK
jgi:hypothetical protein